MLDEGGPSKSTLATISGVGFMAIVLFFYFFMWEPSYSEVYPTMFILIILSALTVVFYLLDDISFMYHFALTREDPEDFKSKVKKASNFMAGLMGMTLVGLNIIVYTQFGDKVSIRILIITLLTLFSVFLLVYSMFMGED